MMKSSRTFLKIYSDGFLYLCFDRKDYRPHIGTDICKILGTGYCKDLYIWRYILNNVICRKNAKERFLSYLIVSLSFALLHYNLNSVLWIEMIFILARFLMFFFYFVLRNFFPQDDRFFLVVILHGLYNMLAIFFLP